MYYDKNLNDAEDFAVRKIKRICFRLINFVEELLSEYYEKYFTMYY